MFLQRKLKNEISATINLKLVSLRDINAGLYLKEDTNNPVQVIKIIYLKLSYILF